MPDPASTIPEAFAGRETKPYCRPGESEPSRALGIMLIMAVVEIVGLAAAVVFWA